MSGPVALIGVFGLVLWFLAWQLAGLVPTYRGARYVLVVFCAYGALALGAVFLFVALVEVMGWA